MQSTTQHTEISHQGLEAPTKVFLPFAGGYFFLFLLALFLFARPLLLLWDGGSCRHFLNGMYFLAHHKLPENNYTSFVFPQIACDTRCWLGDLVSGCAYQMAGLNGLVAIFSLVIAIALVWSFQMARARGLGAVAGLLALVAVLGASSMHWSARCHIYSYIPFLLVYFFCFVWSGRQVTKVIGVSLSVLLAVNLHGSFAVSLFVVASRLAGDFITWFSHNWRKEPKVDTKQLSGSLLAFAAAGMASLVNPGGIAVYERLLAYLTNPVVSALTDEWRPLDFACGPGIWCFLALFAIQLILMVVCRRLLPPADLILFFALFFAGCRSMRMIPYFALIAMPTTALSWSLLKRKALDSKRLRTWHSIFHFEKRAELGESFNTGHSFIFMAIAGIMLSLFAFLPVFKISDFDPDRMPVHTVQALKNLALPEPGFNYDNWGGYIYYRLGKQVFIDDWTDLLPVAFVRQYCALLEARPGWQEAFDQGHFSWALIPKTSQLAGKLAASNQWKLSSQDAVSVLLIRRPSKRELAIPIQ